MRVGDVMTRRVISVAPDATIEKIAELLVERGFSAVPVTDGGRLVGIVSEGDLMRRPETGTERHSSWWLRAFADPDALAARYVKTHGLTARDVMTRDVVTVPENAPLAEAAELLESRGVKRLPVMRGDALVGIVSRANLVRALAMAGTSPGGAHDDTTVRERLDEALEREPWLRNVNVYATVLNHAAHLWGAVATPAQREAIELLASRVPGVTAVHNHLAVRDQRPVPLTPLF